MTCSMSINEQIDLNEEIKLFAKDIGGEQLGLAEYQPELLAKPLCCYKNVLEKIERDGGSGMFGWIFSSRFA